MGRREVTCRNPTTDRQHARLHAPTMMRVARVSTEQFEVAVERDQPASVEPSGQDGHEENEPVKREPYRDDGSYRLPCDPSIISRREQFASWIRFLQSFEHLNISISL
jgi:hypothetical protein